MSEIKEITTLEVKQKIVAGENLILVDVRRLNEWQNGHIDHAIHIPLDQIDEAVYNIFPDKEQLLILYCAAGIRSLTAAKKFLDLGYSNVFSLKGGFSRWS
jgi:rhodanese-related sulfurtransferase